MSRKKKTRKPTPTMFNVFVVFQMDREKQFPTRYPVRTYGTRKKPRYECASLCNDGYHDYWAYSHQQVGAIVLHLHRKYPGAIQEIIIEPARDWKEWINGFQPEDTAQEGGGGHCSSGCEAAYLMTH